MDMNKNDSFSGEKEDLNYYDEINLASQRQLFFWRLIRHKIAVTSGVILILFYVVALFADFVAPYDPHRRMTEYVHAPPSKIHFIHQGRWYPHVFEIEQTLDPHTFIRTYTPIPERIHRVRLFVAGDDFKWLGIIPSKIHVIGVANGNAPLFLLGADQFGRDLFSRIVFGARISLTVGLIGVFFSLVLGVSLGGAAGYFGGIVDRVVNKIIEVLRSFPTIPLWMALSAALPPNWSPLMVYFGITIILSLRGWTGLGRQVRGKFMALKNEDFVLAASFAGASPFNIISRHLVPAFTSHLVASVTLAIPGMILGETALSFIGLGLRPPVVSWGVLLSEAQQIQIIVNYPWLLTPAIFIVLTILSFNFLGDGMRDAADPYGGIG